MESKDDVSHMLTNHASLRTTVDFEKFSALSQAPNCNDDAVPSPPAALAAGNPQFFNDEDSYGETEPEFDDEQDLVELSQKQPSAFHAAMNLEVCCPFFVYGPNSSLLP